MAGKEIAVSLGSVFHSRVIACWKALPVLTFTQGALPCTQARAQVCSPLQERRDINKAGVREQGRILSKQCGMNGAVACMLCRSFLAVVQK